MAKLEVGQYWRTAAGEIVLIKCDMWGTEVLPEDECSGPGTHFEADNGMIYRQYLKRKGRYYTFSWMEKYPTDLISLEG